MPPKRRIYLNNIKNCRYSAAKILRRFYENENGEEENVAWYRCLDGLMKTVLLAHEKETMADLRRRLERIESYLEDDPEEEE